MIKLTQVSKNFGNITALSDINLYIEPGEFVFITGISGSGKTTLLRILTGDLRIDHGSVEIDRLTISKLKSNQTHLLRRTIGVVFQDFKLLLDRTIFENVALAMKVVGKPTNLIDKQVNKTLKLVGLQDKEHLFPLQLAGGELQRVCLARAIVTQPPLLLADEPTGNLDPTTSWQIMELIKRINQQGTTVVMATHNTDIVNSMSERVIQIEKGKMVKDEKKGKYEI